MTSSLENYRIAVENYGDERERENFQDFLRKNRSPEQIAKSYEEYLKESINGIRRKIDGLGKSRGDAERRLRMLQRIRGEQ